MPISSRIKTSALQILVLVEFSMISYVRSTVNLLSANPVEWWLVVPANGTAAIPFDAVTATALPFPLSSCTILLYVSEKRGLETLSGDVYMR